MTGILDTIKGWFGHPTSALKDEAEGGEPIATPPAGLGEDDRETSTNAQTGGASGEPWSGDD